MRLKRSYSKEAIAQFSTLSPRNSSRSLCLLLWLRCVKACSSRLLFLKL